MSHRCLLAETVLPWSVILVVAGMVLVIILALAIWLSRFLIVSPNQVLIVSGRQRRLANGKTVAFRIVKAGSTFILPVIEKVDSLSLEVFKVELPVFKVQTAKGGSVDVDCVVPIKIKGDDDSIAAAAECLLSKVTAEIGEIAGQCLEKHLRSTMGTLSVEEMDQCATKVQAAAADDLAGMGLAISNFTIREWRSGAEARPV
jgi:flotillin